MRALTQIAEDMQALLDELRAHDLSPPKRRRKPSMRNPKTLPLQPTELQREKARKILRAKGFET